MTITRLVTFGSVLALTLPAAMSREKDEAFQGVQRSVQQRTGKEVRWEQDEAARAANLQDARMLLRKPLTVNSAGGNLEPRQPQSGKSQPVLNRIGNGSRSGKINQR